MPATHEGKTIDPISQLILDTLLRLGLQQLTRRFSAAPEVTDVSDGKPTGEFRAQFKVTANLGASLVMVGLQRGDGWKLSVPVKYGEPLRLRVQRGIYQVTAWFFAAAPPPVNMPMLVAIAHDVLTVVSERPQKFTLTGRAPLDSQLAEIRSGVPDGRPFSLPDERHRAILPAPDDASTAEAMPELEIISPESCAYAYPSGQRCIRSPKQDNEFCTLHSADMKVGTSDRMEVVAWVGSR